uniref:procollagen galactosyltransferase 1-like n=1 Tax=Myxine glutinosa TaxID=7769 RepID=UPI00358E79BF
MAVLRQVWCSGQPSPSTLVLFLFVVQTSNAFFAEERVLPESGLTEPTVLLALLARNTAHTLPFFLGAIERLEYPKNRMALWVATDHNVDNTSSVLLEWLVKVQHRYHYIEWRPMEEPRSYPDELSPKHWSASRYEYIMKLRQGALRSARDRWADYIFFVDTDNLIVNHQTLRFLIKQNKTLVSPMLDSRMAYSNYWSAMTKEGYFKRSTNYLPIRERERQGCFPVPMVHSTMLIDLRREATNWINFYPPHDGYQKPFDDIIIFASSCQHAGVQMYVCNQEDFGHIIVPWKSHRTMQDDVDIFIHAHLEIMIDEPPLQPSQFVSTIPKVLDKMGFHEIFVINLIRRPDRRRYMLHALQEQSISCKLVDAVDGATLNKSTMDTLGISMLQSYEDPYSDRPITKGEVGCFLSHYKVWQEVVSRGLQFVLVLEDDVRFELFFRRRLVHLMRDIDQANLEWDLIYLGRKKMELDFPEMAVNNVKYLVRAGYSYWTLVYVLSQSGARKLLSGNPLGRILPVDEYLPIMFDKHPNKLYLEAFENRDLQAFSAEPLLAFPTHYTGEDKYFSDTETSTIWDNEYRQTTGGGKMEGPEGNDSPDYEGAENIDYEDWDSDAEIPVILESTLGAPKSTILPNDKDTLDSQQVFKKTMADEL